MSDLYRARLKVVLRITFARRLAKRAGIAMEDAIPAHLQDMLEHWLRGREPSPAELRSLAAYADDLNEKSRAFRDQERADKKLAKYRETLAHAGVSITKSADEKDSHGNQAPDQGAADQPTAASLDTSIGRALRKARVAKHLDQSAVATLAGLSVRQIQRCEKGRERADLDTLWKICNGLGVGLPAMIEQAQLSVSKSARRTMNGSDRGHQADAPARLG